MSHLPIPIDAGTAVSSHDARWLLVERIVASPPFRKTARLKDLLYYLAEMSIRDESSALTEQQIGQAVFGKSADYSPVEDSSVRVHIRQLRLKLHEYFDCDGRDELLVVEIPKGGYTLAFHPVPPAVVEVRTPQLVLLPPQRPRHWQVIIPWIAVVLLSLLSLFLWQRTRVPARPQLPWPLNAVFGNGHRSEIVLADSTYSVRRHISGEPVSLESYMRRDFQHKANVKAAGSDETYLAQLSADALLTSWADVAISSALLRILPNTLEHVTVRSARELHPRELEDGNFIFCGSPGSNPWVLLFEDRLNFREIRPDGVNKTPKVFLNQHPLPGEQATYQGLTRTGLNGDDFATIALLPSQNGRGNILIIQGLHQEGTEAAGLLLADETGRAKLKSALKIKGDPASPLYFEALLRVEAVGGSPQSASIVASRILRY